MTMYPLDPAEAQAAAQAGTAAEQGRRDHYHGQPEGDLREWPPAEEPDTTPGPEAP